MANNNSKPGMMIYFDYWYAPLRILSGDEVKELLADTIELSKNGQYPDSFSSDNVRVFFNQMEAVVLRDDEQYNKKIVQRKKAGQASANARQRVLTDVNERQQPLTDVNQFNTTQPNTTQLNPIQSNTIQTNTDQYSSTQPNNKYWGDNKLWEQRCEQYRLDPYDPEQRTIFERAWRIEQDDDHAF